MTVTIRRYFCTFSAGGIRGIPYCLNDDVEDLVKKGKIRSRESVFSDHSRHMRRSFRDELADLALFGAEGGIRAAAEFVVNGTYLSTDDELTEEKVQSCRSPAGSFSLLEDGRITRVATHGKPAGWLRQVS